jgi:hypothetical protein
VHSQDGADSNEREKPNWRHRLSPLCFTYTHTVGDAITTAMGAETLRQLWVENCHCDLRQEWPRILRPLILRPVVNWLRTVGFCAGPAGGSRRAQEGSGRGNGRAYSSIRACVVAATR